LLRISNETISADDDTTTTTLWLIDQRSPDQKAPADQRGQGLKRFRHAEGMVGAP
jgi:hypothetical protein